MWRCCFSSSTSGEGRELVRVRMHVVRGIGSLMHISKQLRKDTGNNVMLCISLHPPFRFDGHRMLVHSLKSFIGCSLLTHAHVKVIFSQHQHSTHTRRAQNNFFTI